MASEIRVNKITHTAGVGTITTSADGVVIAGIVTANSFSGNVTGDVTGSGANLTNLPAGQLTGALPAISGANLTGLSGVSVANQADNRLITATGTTDALNGEANLTFSGSLLSVTGNISLPDSAAPDYVGNIYVGNNSDLKIFHNGSDNFIRSGAGNANIRIDNNSGVLGARFIPAGAAELYHNGTKMCETSTNGLAFPSGKGIDFSATADGYSGSLNETLDDYEEGYWTPTVGGWSASGTGVYGAQNGRYTKVGNLVTVFFHVYWTALNNASGVFAIQGLPFAQSSSTFNISTAVQMRYVDYSGDTVFAVGGNGYVTSFLFYAQNDNANHTYVPVDSNGGRIEGTVTYLTDS